MIDTHIEFIMTSASDFAGCVRVASESARTANDHFEVGYSYMVYNGEVIDIGLIVQFDDIESLQSIIDVSGFRS